MSRYKDNILDFKWDLAQAIGRNAGFLSERCAEELAEVVIKELTNSAGGQEVYIPSPSKECRNNQIRQAFNGTNRHELCRRFSISTTSFYRIIRDSKCK
jgi:Mor family transcriptional regulator